MCDRPEEYTLAFELRRERAVRRTMNLLETKRRRMRDDLDQLITHLSLLVPAELLASTDSTPTTVLEDAAARLGDDAFAQLILQLLQEGHYF
ncbi:MAG: hypothetical protein SAJ12_05635 [Jaaginema sp. PMC 1079.18]|nr:hypothetical protein [Jaaginema sp. PMC 1080.18]MEC4850473.1 hypothetical protein [Jaaginema sp. PMC 1079.18]MEC4866577.1 hypothetical protein [Jaaginema sp. PMC 1078.18]